MAVPQTISGLISIDDRAGPFYVNSAVYLLLRDGTNDEPAMVKVADPSTGSFSEVDAANAPTNQPYQRFSCMLTGSDIIVAYGPAVPNALGRVTVFSTSSDTWSQTATDFASGANGAFDGDVSSTLSIVDTASGTAANDLAIIYTHDEKDMGVDYPNVHYSTRNSGTGSWTMQGRLSTANGITHQNGSVVLGASDRFHFFWTNNDGNSQFMHRAANSSLTLQTEQTVDSDIGSSGLQRAGGAIRYDVSGTIHIVAAYLDGSPSTGNERVKVAKADSADAPSWTLEEVSDADSSTTSIDPMCSVDGTTTVVFWRRSNQSPDDMNYDTQADGDTTWGTDATAKSEDGSNHQIARTSMDYGSGSVIGWIQTVGSNTSYNEFSLGGGVVTRNPPAGSLTLAGQSPSLSFTLHPGAGALALAGQAPDRIVDVSREVPTGVLALAGQQSTLLFEVSVPTGPLVLVGESPDALVSVTLDVPTGALTLAGLEPPLVVGRTLDVPVGSLALAGVAPSLSFELYPDAGPLVLSGQTPLRLIDDPTPVPSGLLTLAGQGASLDFSVYPASGELVLQGETPGLGIDAIFEPPVGALVLTGQVPSVLVPVFIEPSVGLMVLNGNLVSMAFVLAMPEDDPC